MTAEEDATKLKLEDWLSKFGQLHLLDFWEELSADERRGLAGQIDELDFALIRRLLDGESLSEDWGSVASRSMSPRAIRQSGDDNPYSPVTAHRSGHEAYSAGKMGIVLVAGGQGTRLGFPHPKGMFPIGPVSNRTLFEIHADRILAANRKYGVEIPLYLMTSPATHDETVAFLDTHEQLGLPHIRVFCQGTMPAVDAETGRVLLAEKGRLFESPDGHGGTLAALDRNGCLKDMQARGVERLIYFQIDNPMVNIDDPEFVGYHILSGSEMTSRVVAKQDPKEKVGVVVSVDGVLQIIEYSDLPDEHAERRNADGSLAIWAGSIAVHIFDVEFLERAKTSAKALPFHRANKKVPFVDSDGFVVQPAEPNAIKFERFIFDLLPSAKNGLVVEVDEATAFAPLKNAKGSPKDTEQTVRAAMVAQHRKWLEAAGGQVADGVQVEINPRFAGDADELAEKIERGLLVSADRYFGPPEA